VNGRIVVVDRWNDGVLASAGLLDPRTGRWETIAPMSKPHYHSSAAVVANRFCVFGGSGDKSAEVYDPETD